MPKNSDPIAAKKTRPTEPTAAENRGLRNSRTSRAGNATRNSYATKAARISTPAAIVPSTRGEVQSPESPPVMIPYTKVARPATDSSTPTASIRPGDGLRDSGTSTVIAISPAITTGTLMRNTEPHQKCSSSRPPTTGPIATASPTAPAQTPMARPRSRGSKTLEMIASVAGMIAAAPRPISARAPMSCPGVCEYALASEAMPKIASPVISTRRRPSRSPRMPAVNSSPAKTSV